MSIKSMVGAIFRAIVLIATASCGVALLNDPPLEHLSQLRTTKGSLQILKMSFGREHHYLIDPLHVQGLRSHLPASVERFLPYGQICIHTEESSFVLWTKLQRRTSDRSLLLWRMSFIDESGGEIDAGILTPIVMRMPHSDLQGWPIPGLLRCGKTFRVRLT